MSVSVARRSSSDLARLQRRYFTVMYALCPDQPDERDLRRNPEPHRRPPIPGAAAGVDPQAAEPVQPRGERLLQAHQKIPRPELAAVGVPRAATRGSLRCEGSKWWADQSVTPATVNAAPS